MDQAGQLPFYSLFLAADQIHRQLTPYICGGEEKADDREAATEHAPEPSQLPAVMGSPFATVTGMQTAIVVPNISASPINQSGLRPGKLLSRPIFLDW